VFKLNAEGRFTVLHNFLNGMDGAGPRSGTVILGEQGNLYGTTEFGGPSPVNQGGTVFKIDRNGREAVLYRFKNSDGPDGGAPSGSLVRDAQGNLYGTTTGGGTYDRGAVFKVDPAGNETVLYSFTDGPDGGIPQSGLIRDEQGNLYGTTLSGGGPDYYGTVFKVDPTGAETVLHSFTGSPDGRDPIGGLIRDQEGNLYGTTSSGGTHSGGTVFKLDSSGKETVLYSFTGAADGQYPAAGVIRDEKGNLYGTTVFGGTSSNPACSPNGSGCGVVFKLDPAGKETVLYAFSSGADGSNPYAPLVRDKAGNLYGTTNLGGNFGGECGLYGCGVVFKVTLSDGGKGN
jgi:uncharacterized repeat protein (TIGR03803 family)